MSSKEYVDSPDENSKNNWGERESWEDFQTVHLKNLQRNYEICFLNSSGDSQEPLMNLLTILLETSRGGFSTQLQRTKQNSIRIIKDSKNW